MFQDVTSTSLIFEQGRSFGSAWGDFNQDGWVDLWVSNHGRSPSIYQNLGNGTFQNVALDLLPSNFQGDHHAAAWADFDNDGDLDLIQLVGGDSGTSSLTDLSSANLLFVNEGNIFREQALPLGLGYVGSSGRTPLWYDQNNDGLLDLFHGAAPRPDDLVPATIFQQHDTGFADLTNSLDFDLSSPSFATLSDVFDGNQGLELIVSQPNKQIAVYDSVTLEDLSDQVLTQDYRGRDFISEDFNGDLLPDLYITRRGLSNSGFTSPDNQTINLNLNVNTDSQGLNVQTEGTITLKLWTFGFNFEEIAPENIFIGSSGLNPIDFNIFPDQNTRITTEITLHLDPQDSRVNGIADFSAGIDEGIYLGYDPNTSQWQISVSSQDKDLVAAVIESESDIISAEAINFNNDLEPSDDLLLINQDGKLQDVTAASNLNSVRTAGVSTVAGDFDNDMDQDIYVLTANSAGNEPNVLYENQGDGTFIAAQDLNDGFGSSVGVGESVTTTDYNNDGFLDLFITNGRFPNLLNRNAPYQLLENEGNDHHWLMIDLEGTISNRDAIGSTVYLTAGGVTQLRQQSGGIHNRAQNDSRLHFGLADNTVVDEIEIHWASGHVQTLTNVEADRLLNIVEPQEASLA